MFYPMSQLDFRNIELTWVYAPSPSGKGLSKCQVNTCLELMDPTCQAFAKFKLEGESLSNTAKNLRMHFELMEWGGSQ